MSTIEEKRRQHILESIEAMAGGVPSPERLEERNLERGHNSQEERFDPQELQAYEDEFLYPEHFQNKISCSLNRHTIDSLRYILSQLQPNISLVAYIDHILWAHLRSHQELLNRAIDSSRRKNIISNKP